MGLLDDFTSFLKTPEGIGVASGLAGLMGYAQAQEGADRRLEEAQQRKLRDLQMGQLQGQIDDQNKVRDFYGNLSKFNVSPVQQALSNGQGPTIANEAQIPKMAGGFNAKSMYEAMLNSGSPTLAQAGLAGLTKQDDPITLAEGASLVRKDGTQIASNASNKPINGYLVRGADGNYAVDPKLFEAERVLKATGATRVNNNINTQYEPAFNKEMAQLDAKSLDGMRAKAEAGSGMLNSIARMRNLNDKVYSNGTAEAKLATANFLAGLGVNVGDPAKLAASQEFDSLAGKLTLDSLGGSLGPGVSNSDVQFIKKTAPQLGHSAEARQQMYDFLERKAKQQVDAYSDARSYAEKNGGLRGWTPPKIEEQKPQPSQEFSVTAPNGKVYFFPDAKSAANFKLKAGGR